MTAQKIAFCFPGQGSLEVGMGREIARAVPEAMDVFVRGSEASGLDLVRLCFEAPEEELVQTEVQQPALVATSLAVLAALRSYGYRNVRTPILEYTPLFVRSVGEETDVVGKAVIVHAKADDYKTDPAGNAGDRIACGVITESGSAATVGGSPRN